MKKLLLNIKSPILGNFEQYGFVWVWCSKIWFTTVVLTENKVKVGLLNIFHSSLPCFQALFKWQINNKHKVIPVFIFSIFYSTLLYSVWRNALRSWRSKPLEKPWISNSKTEQWLMSLGNKHVFELVNMHVFVTCKIDVVNKNNLHSRRYEKYDIFSFA